MKILLAVVVRADLPRTACAVLSALHYKAERSHKRLKPNCGLLVRLPLVAPLDRIDRWAQRIVRQQLPSAKTPYVTTIVHDRAGPISAVAQLLLTSPNSSVISVYNNWESKRPSPLSPCCCRMCKTTRSWFVSNVPAGRHCKRVTLALI